MIAPRKLLALLALIAALALAGCSAPESPTPTAMPTPTPSITANQVLEQAIAAVDHLDSFHFSMEVKNGTFPLFEGINSVHTEGDATRPDRWRAFFKTDVWSPSLIEMRGIGDQVQATDPRTGNWIPYDTSASPAAFFDPDRGAQAMFQGITRPARLAGSSVGGGPAYHIRGRIDTAKVEFITGAVELDTVVGIDVWIRKKDYYLVRMILTGKIEPTDPPDIVRTINLSGFNEEVQIEEP